MLKLTITDRGYKKDEDGNDIKLPDKYELNDENNSLVLESLRNITIKDNGKGKVVNFSINIEQVVVKKI